MIRFWENKTLTEMTLGEWESLCDGCGQCCLHKLVNEETADVFYTRVACRLLNTETAQCQHYETRRERVSDCLDVRNMDASELAWMPASCAYRRLSEGKTLPLWHPLLTGDPQSVLSAGMSVTDRTISEDDANLDDLETEIIEWVAT